MKMLRQLTVIEWLLLAATLWVVVTSLAGCTDATWGSYEALGKPAHVQCFSGTAVFYDGKSTGRVAPTQSSDGWEFIDAATGKFVRVSGACLVESL